MKHRGKKYSESKKLVSKPAYGLKEAVVMLKKTSPVKFDASCEIHMKLGVDPKQADQIVRGTVVLPHGTGKKLRVIAFVNEANEKSAKEAGAVDAGMHLVEKIEKGWLDFDVAVATPDVMKSLGKIAKTLGQKGLMPNPKAGTVSPDVKKMVSEIMKGKVEFRVDQFGIVHNTFGKVSFDDAKLEENLKTFISALMQAKPSGVKGTYIESVSLATSMGPGLWLDLSKAMSEAMA